MGKLWPSGIESLRAKPRWRPLPRGRTTSDKALPHGWAGVKRVRSMNKWWPPFRGRCRMIWQLPTGGGG